MSQQPNPARQLMQDIFAGLATGDSRAFLASLSDDFCWTVPGGNSWSGTYRGKEAVQEQLLRPLFRNFATRYTNTAQRFIAQGDWVAVQCQGAVMTHSGHPYDNRYVWLCRVEDGRLREVIEFMDTELAARVLAPRDQAGS
jgi:ketosteroid isomerase-like protein